MVKATPHNWSRVALSGVLAAALMFLTVSTALASIIKSGTKTCTPNQTAYTHAKTTGDADGWSPGARHYSHWNSGGNWVVTTIWDDPGAGGGYWQVQVYGGSMNDAGTYAACFNGTYPI